MLLLMAGETPRSGPAGSCVAGLLSDWHLDTLPTRKWGSVPLLCWVQTACRRNAGCLM